MVQAVVRGRSIDGAVPLAASRWTLGVRCIHGRGHGRTRRLVSANLEHDLATRPAARDPLERRAGLRARKNRVDALPFPGTQSANDDSYSLYATWPVRLALIACT